MLIALHFTRITDYYFVNEVLWSVASSGMLCRIRFERNSITSFSEYSLYATVQKSTFGDVSGGSRTYYLNSFFRYSHKKRYL